MQFDYGTWLRHGGGKVCPARRPGDPRGADRDRQEDPGRTGLGRLAGVHGANGSALSAQPPRLLGPAQIRGLAAELGVRPTKTLGQNFVHDANTVRRIVATAGVDESDRVLEVGPGLGSLTLALLGAAGSVEAVKSIRCWPLDCHETIAEYARPNRIRSTSSRLMRCGSPRRTCRASRQRWSPTCPGNVAVPVLLHLMSEVDSLRTALVMVQAEVADRLAAEPGSRVYGIPSVKARYFGRVSRAGAVGRNVFWPEPKVESGFGAHRPDR